MTTARNIAKYLIKSKPSFFTDTYEGNMKLQKLLFFANLISLAEKNEPLFVDPIHALPNGCVVETVRGEYKNEYQKFFAEDGEESIHKSDEEIMCMTLAIFGSLPAKELSRLNHTFYFWQRARAASKNLPRDLEKAYIPTEEMKAELSSIREVIAVYKSTMQLSKQVIEGVTFFYDENFKMTQEIISELTEMAKELEENSYSIYMEGESLVVF